MIPVLMISARSLVLSPLRPVKLTSTESCTDGRMSDSGSQSDSVPSRVPVKPPRVPPPVLRAPAAAQLAPPSMTTTTGYRARALAKVSKAVQSTSEYVSPRLDSVKQSAVGRLELLRDRHDSWEADRDRSLGTPSRSFSSSSRQNSVLRDRDYVDPVLAAKRGTSSSSTSTSSTDQQSRWGGWANYFSSNYRKDRDPSTYGSEMIVSFPGVSVTLVGLALILA